MPEFETVPRTAPTQVSGYRDPSNTLSTRIVADVQDEILFYLPNASPLLVLTSRFRRRRKATQYRYDWMEKDLQTRTATITTNQTSGDTSIALTAGQGARFAANYTLLNVRTRELIFVSSISTDTLTVVRGIGGGAAAMLAGDVLTFVSPAFEDGVGLGDIRSVAETGQYNYTQIVRTAFGFSGRQMNTLMYGGKDVVTEKQWQNVEHSRSIEKMLMFGKRHTRTGSNNRVMSFAGGLEFFTSTNVWDVSGIQLSERSFVEFLEEAMKWGKGGYLSGSSTKYAFLSARWMTEIQFWARDKLEYTVLDKQIGLVAMKFVSTFGTVMLMHSPILDEDHAGWGFICDLNHTRNVYHQGRDTKLLMDRQDNDMDAQENEHFSDIGFELELEASCAVMKGLS